MRELDDSVLVEIERLEAQPEATWDKDLLRFREFLEFSLPPGPDDWRIVCRFMHDPEFSRLTMGAMLASIDAERKKRVEEDRQLQGLWDAYFAAAREEQRQKEERRRQRLELVRRPIRAVWRAAQAVWGVTKREERSSQSSPVS